MSSTAWSHESDMEAFGDSGPWVRHLPRAWWMAASPAGATMEPPPDPTDEFVRGGGVSDRRLHGDLIAYWAPLMHLCHFGLGWPRPDLGLSRWLEMGAPTDDPVLAVIARWWSPERLRDFLAWAAVSPSFAQFAQHLANVAGTAGTDAIPRTNHEMSRRSTEWAAVWGGGGDPLHLIDHARIALDGGGSSTGPGEVRRTDSATPTESGAAHRALVVPTYGGWYLTLLRQQPTSTQGRSVRTDVVCPAVGWLGQYRKSRKTGLHFRGRHRWHELGH